MMMLLTMPREEEDDPCSVAISASRITGLTVGSAVASSITSQSFIIVGNIFYF